MNVRRLLTLAASLFLVVQGVERLAHPDGMWVWLYTTAPMLLEAIECFRRWNVSYVTNGTWVKMVKDGTFRGGVYQFGLAERGVGYVYDENNRALIPDSVRARLESLREDIVAGRIVVPSTRE